MKIRAIAVRHLEAPKASQASSSTSKIQPGARASHGDMQIPSDTTGRHSATREVGTAIAIPMDQGAPLCLSRKAQMPRLGSPGQIRCGSDVAVIAPGAELAKSLAETALEASLFMGSQGFVDVV